MAGSGFLALLDDIVAVLDDVAVMSKVAAQKTAGIAGDDLAVGAQQVVGVDPKRELPVIYRVARGSLKNKFFLIPAALGLSLVMPWAITPVLMAGGAYLCFEGLEKVVHKKNNKDAAHDKALLEAAHTSPEALVAFEKDKITKAIRTDAILSAEIIAISLKSVEDASFAMQATVLTVIGIGMTVGIYGLVAGIVKLDDIGLHLLKKKGADLWSHGMRALGQGLVHAAPPIMKTLSVVGTAAMFIVGGGILLHGIPPLHHGVEVFASGISSNGFVQGVISTAASIIMGLAAGAIVLAAVHVLKKPFAGFTAWLRRLFKKEQTPHEDDMPHYNLEGMSDTAFRTPPDLTGEMNASAQRPGQEQKAEKKHVPKPAGPKPPRM